MLKVDIESTRYACSQEVGLLDAEYIYKLTLEVQVFVSSTQDLNLALALTKLTKGIYILNITMHRLIDILLAMQFVEYALQTLVVLAQHHYIYVVIPGYKALMSCRTKERTRT